MASLHLPILLSPSEGEALWVQVGAKPYDQQEKVSQFTGDLGTGPILCQHPGLIPASPCHVGWEEAVIFCSPCCC